ncbi:DUF3019 domain-containing protein [Aestuariibacter sp. A3R04]|uniref:DUF3019 domain-containing protein n=1 Tax=Aestuariibacter sp. A3R04 TaxID=2841571 RepID=UPI00352D3880
MWAFAVQEEWQVSPQTCITAYFGDQCNMDVSIHLPSDQRFPLCLYLESEHLSCFQRKGNFTQQVNLREDSLLYIKDRTGNTVFSQKLMVKWEYRQDKRRVRDPWSLF